MSEENNNGTSGKKPDFNLKADGNFVGAGWLNEGIFGPYVSLVFNRGIAETERVYLYPRKGKEKLLAGE